MERGVGEIGRGGDELGIEIWAEADADVAGVEREAAAGGFKQGFLEGPELEEVIGLACNGEECEVADFIGGEDIWGDFIAGEVGVDALEIDADGIVSGDGDGREVAGV